MSDQNELEEFRKQWREELTTDKEPDPDITKRNVKVCEEPRTDDGNVQSTSTKSADDPALEHRSSNYARHPLHNINSAKQKENTLQPFLIAETLLKGEDAKQYLSSPKTKSDTRSRTSNSDSDEAWSPRKRLRIASSEKAIAENTEKMTPNPTGERFLDIFLHDLNEINEIPFFDTSLPREVAIKMFQYLDAVDLCRCSQVSVAWRSLAEDELLWCRICQQLGFEQDCVTADNVQWKQRVREHVERERYLQLNWKNRTGRFRQLEYVAGGVLTAANSHGGTVVAGYTSGHVKLWDLDTIYERTFNPSTTALVLDEDHDSGTLSNCPSSLDVCDLYCAAGYTQGTVDVWRIEGDTVPLHTFKCPHQISDLCWSPSGTLLAASHGSHVRVESFNHVNSSFEKTDELDFERAVRQVSFVPRGPHSVRRSQQNLLVVNSGDQVTVHQPGTSPDHMTSLHHVIGSVVDCFDCDMNDVAVAMSYYDVAETYKDKVKLYSVHTGQELLELKGHTWTVHAVNLRDSPHNRLVTGSGDKKVRVYDLRLKDPALVLCGHATTVTCVQMDDWKVVSGAQDGLLCVWDQRMSSKLWDMHNRHPVRHLQFRKQLLVTANVPRCEAQSEADDVDSMAHRRYRGSLHAYDFSTTQETEGVPSICLSTYDEPEPYNYNIRLAMPYDSL